MRRRSDRLQHSGRYQLHLDRCDKPETSASQRLYITRIVGRVAQRLANLVDRARDAALEVDVGVYAPNLPLQLFARDDLTRPGEQRLEHAEWLPLQLDPKPGPAELTGLQIGFEVPIETIIRFSTLSNMRRVSCSSHPTTGVCSTNETLYLEHSE